MLDGFGVAGVELDGFLQGGDCVGGAVLALEHDAEVHPGIGRFGDEREARTQLGFGFLEPVECLECDAETERANGGFGIGAAGSREQGKGIGGAVLLKRERAGQMQRVKVRGGDAERLRVKGVGLGEPVGLMVGERVLKDACESRGHGSVGWLGRARQCAQHSEKHVYR